jgi:hypothetical protein
MSILFKEIIAWLAYELPINIWSDPSPGECEWTNSQVAAIFLEVLYVQLPSSVYFKLLSIDRGAGHELAIIESSYDEVVSHKEKILLHNSGRFRPLNEAPTGFVSLVEEKYIDNKLASLEILIGDHKIVVRSGDLLIDNFGIITMTTLDENIFLFFNE